MAASSAPATAPLPRHSAAFRRRRFLNWFPLGVTYALLYMGRYNLTVAKTSLGELMTKEDFGLIFGAGTVVYAFSFLINGPMIDRIGGRKGMLAGAAGAALANFAMGAYLHHVLQSGTAATAPLVTVFSVLYALNMYFQSFGAVSIVKVNAHWFHVGERGGFSGIFGTMISGGIFLAFTGNTLLLKLAQKLWPTQSGPSAAWVVFAVPGVLLAVFFAVELGLLRDRPALAGHSDFDTGDASSGEGEAPIPAMQLFKRILTNPVIVTVALIEFCTGVLRNGVMHWFPIYAYEIWALPSEHALTGGALLLATRDGSWAPLWPALPCFAAAAISGYLVSKSQGRRRAYYAVFAGLAFVAPFFQGGWGGLLMAAGVLGGNIAGWVSDLFFQSRRGPVAAVLYGVLAVAVLGMSMSLATPTNQVASADPKSGLVPGDRILAIGADTSVQNWQEVRDSVACVKPQCKASGWDSKRCMCTSAKKGAEPDAPSQGVIAARIERDGQARDMELPDPKPVQRAGDRRLIKARPVLPLSPFVLGALVILMSLCVIGTHGVMSGTATMDFGGRKAAATAVGVIDGFVYLGTALQSVALGFLTTKSWSYWPWFLLPFAIIGFVLCLRIWNAKPGARGGH